MTGKYLIEAGGENPGIVVPMGQYMTQWCLFYSQEPQFLQRVIAEIQSPAQKLQQLVAEIPAKFSEDELQLSKKLINKLTEDTP